MPGDSPLFEPMLAALRAGPEAGAWTKAVFSRPRASSQPWERLVAEPVLLADGPSVRLTITVAGRVSMRTVRAPAWRAELDSVLAAAPEHINVLGAGREWHARKAKSGRWLVSTGKPSLPGRAAPATHDRMPRHPLPADDPDVRDLFVQIGLFGHSGQLRGEAAAKHRQVQHFVELLRPLRLFQRPAGSPLVIVDAGCGKAYLSLALYLFARRAGLAPELHCVDREPGVIAAVEAAARRLGYDRVYTHAEDIAAFSDRAPGRCDLLVSLHACDTASDDAIVAGITLGAEAIVVAPCCHHELVEQIETAATAGRSPAEWAAALGSGLLRHRLADVITDALRTAALEARGYEADVLEFVDAEATSRNLMIRAERRPAGSGTTSAAATGKAQFAALADAWNLHPSVARALNANSATARPHNEFEDRPSREGS